MKRINSKGFTLVEGLLILIVVCLVGIAGLYVWNTNKDKRSDSSTSQKIPETQTVAKTEEKAAPPVAEVDKNPGYVTVKEWGLAIRAGDASNSDKLTYRINKTSDGQDRVEIILKDNLAKSCKFVGLGFIKASTKVNDKYLPFGDAYYAPIGGSDEACDRTKETKSTLELLDTISSAVSYFNYDIKTSN